MDKEKEKMLSLLEELLRAVKFLIYFQVAVTACKSKMYTMTGLKIAFNKTDGYLKEEISKFFSRAEDLF